MNPLPIAAARLTHLLLMELEAPAGTGGATRSLLLELLAGTEVYRRESDAGRASCLVDDGNLVVLFAGEAADAMMCALELWDTLRDLPAFPFRIAVCTGEVEIALGPDGRVVAKGAGIEEGRRLLAAGEMGQLQTSRAYAEALGEVEAWAAFVKEDDSLRPTPRRHRADPHRVVFLGAEPPEARRLLQAALTADGHEAQGDVRGRDAADWAYATAASIRAADVLVVFVSDAIAGSELLQQQLEIAVEERRRRGAPLVLPVWLNDGITPVGPLASLDRSLFSAVWKSAEDNDRLVQEVRAALETGLVDLEPDRLDSFEVSPVEDRYYVRRQTDDEFEAAVRMQESIVLVKGPHQMGKTTLIARGIEFVRELGWASASTDFQRLSGSQLESERDFYRVLASTLSRQLGFEFDFDAEWIDELGPNLNMDGFLRTLLERTSGPVVWFIDEADRLFTAPFSSEFFGLVRAWHNARATDPRGPRSRLTIVIGYATEAHLFIRDLNRSPFNVGVPLMLAPFTLANGVDLNERYGQPLANPDEIRALHALLGGQPFLTRRAFELLRAGEMDFATLVATADRDDGPFGDHLKRVLLAVSLLPSVWDVLGRSFENPELPDSEGLQRLIAAGVLVRKSGGGYELPSELYRRYLGRFAGGRQRA